jgi:hypothetical protein
MHSPPFGLGDGLGGQGFQQPEGLHDRQRGGVEDREVSRGHQVSGQHNLLGSALSAQAHHRAG